MKLKEQMRWYLNERNMTAAQLARETGISKSVICDWLAGASPKNIKQVKRVADAFEITLDTLCFGVSGIDSKVSNTIDLETLIGETWVSGLFEVKVRRLSPNEKEKANCT